MGKHTNSRQFTDTYRHKGMRRQLIRGLRKKGISDERVLQVIGTLPRHFFFDIGFDDWAYKDVAFPIGEEQTISQPYTVAYQSALLDIEKGDKVLEIGTGSGYQAAILHDLGGKVYTIERHESLFHKTRELLSQLGYYKIRTLLGDGFEGLESRAPFDKIIVTAAPDEIPEKLYKQLRIGGRLVFPLGGKDDHQQMIRMTRAAEGPDIEKFDFFRFVPMVPGVNKGSGGR